MSWRRLLPPWKMIRCPGCGVFMRGHRCPSCDTVVLPDRSIVNDATFPGDVYMGAYGTIVGPRFEAAASKVEVAGDAYFANGLFNGAVEVNAGGHATLQGCSVNHTGTGAALSLTGAGRIVNNVVLSGSPAAGGFAIPSLGSWPRSPAPELELTFGTDALVAWRAWRLIRFERRGGVIERRLAPYASSTPWSPRKRVEAMCTASGTHDAPSLDCTCGIWAFHTREGAEDLDCTVVGSVSLWGRVLEFERGYRAQFAYPKQLFVGDQETAEELARVYGVPVEVAA